jgi:hypothetical protein
MSCHAKQKQQRCKQREPLHLSPTGRKLLCVWPKEKKYNNNSQLKEEKENSEDEQHLASSVPEAAALYGGEQGANHACNVARRLSLPARVLPTRR